METRMEGVEHVLHDNGQTGLVTNFNRLSSDFREFVSVQAAMKDFQERFEHRHARKLNILIALVSVVGTLMLIWEGLRK